MPTTVWPWCKKRYTCSAFSIFEQAQEQFVSTMRTGIDPAGHELSKEMPWRPIGKMDDEELGAIYEYLIHLPDFQSSATR